MPAPDVFISYSHGDEKSRSLSEDLSKVLGRAGVHVWVDKTTITPGEMWHEQIEKALEDSQTFVFLLSPRALKSEWTNFEIGVAASRAERSPDVRIIPVLIGGSRWEAVPEVLRKSVGIDANKMSKEEAAAAVARAVISTGV